jgi:hypothetical protein
MLMEKPGSGSVLTNNYGTDLNDRIREAQKLADPGTLPQIILIRTAGVEHFLMLHCG